MEAIDYQQIVQLITALGIGFLIGLERERRQENEIFAGIRTLPLVALTGALLYDQFPELLLAGFLFLAALLVVGYVAKIREYGLGMTTAVATMLTFIYGAMCVSSEEAMMLAVMLGILTALLLAFKPPLHSFANAVEPEEMYAVLKFLVVALVVFPLLPNRSVDLLLGLNPQFVWLMVVFVSGIGFGAYVLSRLFGAKAGIGLAGLLGGLISSTATTVAMSRKSMTSMKYSSVASLAIVIACVAMFPRMILELVVVYPALVEAVMLPVVVMVVLPLLPALYLVWVTTRQEMPEMKPENPFSLQPALIFGVLFGIILLASEYSKEMYGDAGILVTALVSGLADVDAITISVGRLMEQGKLGSETGRNAVVLGAISNTFMKVCLTWILGHRKLAIRVTAVMGLSVLGGVVTLLLM